METQPLTTASTAPRSLPRRLRPHLTPLALIGFFWAVLQMGGLFTPGLLDDVDSVYLQIAREMLHRHDWVTPTIDGIRFFDKPPLMYWLAALSMRVFGEHDWAGRLPLAVATLGLGLATYALGLRLLQRTTNPARGGTYAAFSVLTCLGTYLYTRFYIPDITVALWMTLAVHCVMAAVDRAERARSAAIPAALFGIVVALNVLTKGLIGFVFPVGFAVIYLLWIGRLRLLAGIASIVSGAVFLVVALPWHILAALRNPPVPMPPGLGLPARAGWAWFYLYNEHVARFLGRRIPHDYGQVPIPIFWLLLVLWIAPWATFLPGALLEAARRLRACTPAADREMPRVTLLWAGLILGFFTLSSRQEYYHLPALPALALLIGAWLAEAEAAPSASAARSIQRAAAWLLTPVATLLALVCAWYAATAPSPHTGVTLTAALSSNPALYNLSLGHVFDLTGAAMGYFRGPLAMVAGGMLLLGPVALVLRRHHAFAANLLIACGMAVVLRAAHVGLVRFYPTLGSEGIADLIRARPALDTATVPLLIDGELTSGSSLLFYTRNPVYLVDGRVNGPWFGSFWPDAPHIFLTGRQLPEWWARPRPTLLMTYHPAARIAELCAATGIVTEVGTYGDKTLLLNVSDDDKTNVCSIVPPTPKAED